ncbi:MAG: chemotaxis protein CheA [Candidatus Zixiibacteriota bacterium]
MDQLETRVESLASDLVLASVDDLPALARLHEDFLTLLTHVEDSPDAVKSATQKCAEQLEKIILNDVPDRSDCLTNVGEALNALQQIIVEKRDLSEVKFPDGFGPDQATQKTEIPQADEAKSEPLLITVDSTNTSLIEDFVIEAEEHCATAEQMLMDLESDTGNAEAINAIFRSFHTIKGAAGFLELKPISMLAHESETLLDLARKGTVIIQGQIADAILSSIDAMRAMLTGVRDVMRSGESFDAAGNVISLIEKLKYLIANAENDTDLDSIEAELSDRVGDVLVDMGALSQADIDDALARKQSPDEKIGQTLVKQGKVSSKAVIHALRDQERSRRGTTVKEQVKIDTRRLDRLVDTIGELVIAESMISQNEEILAVASTQVIKNISHLNKITRELQEMGMAMRLVPVQSTFQKLARAVRDLSKRSGKNVNLHLSGEDSEVDRSIVEKIGDPLMHMVRNSIDHGLETADERARVGKPLQGNLWIRAYHKGGNICMEIEDDGRGLDKDKILAKGREKGLVPTGRDLTDREIYNLIMLPGFSTAAKVTDISGRGVGMDVVKKNIDSMRGHVEIESSPGDGTKFTIKLPLTLAIIDGMLVRIAQHRYIVPTMSIIESLNLTPDMIFTVCGRSQMIDWRGKPLPLVKTADLFGLEPESSEFTEGVVVVVEESEKVVGLIVDELLGQRQTVIKSLGPIFMTQKWISGGAILSNGNVGLIIDISGLMELAGMTGHGSLTKAGTVPTTTAMEQT